ncbi:MAG: hypothetical protein F6J93_00105 [Oscillatoria sp. SIO1A7]|nr:hypothetical protein [Oscillatoria sp. SIO1A7]
MTSPKTLLENLDILVQEGIYKDKEALLQDAKRALLRSKPELRGLMAIALYKREDVSLTRGSEIAGVDVESFKEMLREAGVERSINSVGHAIHHEVEQLIGIA